MSAEEPGHGSVDERGFRAAFRWKEVAACVGGEYRAGLSCGPDALARWILLRHPAADAVALSRLLHGVVDCFATRVRRRGDVVEATLTRWTGGPLEAGEIVGMRRGDRAFPVEIFSVDPEGRVRGPAAYDPIPLEHVAWEFLREESADAPDQLSMPEATAFVEGEAFRRVLEGIVGADLGTPSGLPGMVRTTIASALGRVVSLSRVIGPFLDTSLLEALHARRQFPPRYLTGWNPTRHVLTTNRFPFDAYGWIKASAPEASRRRRQAFDVAPFAIGQFSPEASSRIDAGDSVVDVLREAMDLEDVIDTKRMARVVRAFSRRGDATDRGGVGGSGVAPREGTDFAWVRDLARICVMTGGTDVLERHPVDVVYRAGSYCSALYRHRWGRSGPVSIESSSFPRSVASAMLREAPALADLMTSGGLDWIRTIQSVVLEAFDQEGIPDLGGPVSDDGRTMLEILLRDRASVRSLVRASDAWHAGAGRLQSDLEFLCGGSDRRAEPPTAREVELPSGRIRWLVTSAELREEGEAMRHCVAGFSQDVLTARIFVAAIGARDGTRATASFGRMSEGHAGKIVGVPRSIEFRGVANEDPPDACVATMSEFLAAISDGSIAWTEPERTMPEKAGFGFPPEVRGEEILACLRPWLPRRQSRWTVEDWRRAYVASECTRDAVSVQGEVP